LIVFKYFFAPALISYKFTAFKFFLFNNVNSIQNKKTVRQAKIPGSTAISDFLRPVAFRPLLSKSSAFSRII